MFISWEEIMADRSKSIRNIALVGHSGAGKTTLAETMLFLAGEISEKGSNSKGTVVMLSEPEEFEKGTAITPHFGHCNWKDATINLVNTPGHFDFIESDRAVFPGTDSALVIFDSTEEVKPETDRLWQFLHKDKTPVCGFVNFMDREDADFERTLAAIHEIFHIPTRAVTLPIKSDGNFIGIIDLITGKAWTVDKKKQKEIPVPENMKDKIETYRSELIEKAAETDEELLEKFFEGEEFSVEEFKAGLKQTIAQGDFMPVFCGSSRSGIGVPRLLDSIVELFPSPIDRDSTVRAFKGVDPADNSKEIPLPCKEDEPFCALTLKTTIDPFSGRLSVIRVVSGTVKGHQTIQNTSRNVKQMSSHTYRLQGKELVQADELYAGEIGAISKLEDTYTGDTLCDPDRPVLIPPVKFADPTVMYAIEATSGSEEKVAAGFAKICAEDPALHFYRDEETHDLILAGASKTHLELAIQILERKFGAKATLKKPKVPYRETIRKSVRVQGKLKKQTGGHGQFANCWIEVEPIERGAGFEFESQIVGGVIPKQYIPSVEKGVQEAMRKGIIGGYPVIDVRVKLVDGSFHSVDSSDYAFQVAGSMAFKKALEEADPVLLEPIMKMEITVPEDTTGDVVKDLSGRRGRVLNMIPAGKKQIIEAEAPLPEVLEYGNSLNSITAGQGMYTMSVSSYREVPDHIKEKLLAEEAEAANG
ncbi:MAG: elongation factor G [Candidatus Dadabacteria bacterium]|nr:MAG: elongation factor G [Candidatus Dadabacteria bacterium]